MPFAGVAFSSDAASSGASRTLLQVSATQAAATYTAVVIQRGKHREAKKLLDFISSRVGARCLKRCGLRPIKADNH